MALIDLNSETEYALRIRQNYGKYLGIKLFFKNSLFINGADAAIHMLISYICKNKRVLFLDLNYHYASHLIKTFSSKHVCLTTQKNLATGHRLIPDFSLDFDIFYVTNPDNIFGFLISTDQIYAISKQNPEKLIIVDESYADYCLQDSVALSGIPNIVVVRTFSKFFELEDSRIACIISPRVNELRKFIPQYPIASTSVRELDVALTSINKQKARNIADLKFELFNLLSQLGISLPKSHTNFVTLPVRLFGPELSQKILALRPKLIEQDSEHYFRLLINRDLVTVLSQIKKTG